MPGGAVFTSTALAAVLIEGLIFIILMITNVREAIVNAISASLRNAIGVGIGLFIAFIGLILTGFLYVKKVPGAILLGIIITMVIGIPMGVTEFKGILSSPESIKPIFFQFQFDHIWSLDMLAIVFTFLSINFITNTQHTSRVRQV